MMIAAECDCGLLMNAVTWKKSSILNSLKGNDWSEKEIAYHKYHYDSYYSPMA
jgi:hypothetical protein